MDHLAELEAYGRAWCRKFLTANEVKSIALHCDIGCKPGVRLQLLKELLSVLGPSGALSCLMVQCGVDRMPVRLVAFNKTSESNWGVPWHQDRIVALKQRKACAGYGNWLSKDGFWHCEPPLAVMTGMLFIRIHIDACEEENGAMEIALGSHRLGFVSASSAAREAGAFPKEICAADPGDVLVVKALTLHRSKVAVSANSRRAIRVDYARRGDLDPQLEWAIAG